MPDKLEELERLSRLLDEGRISEAEYKRLKSELIANPSNDGSDDGQLSDFPAPYSPRPGWYNDPEGRDVVRYWDGEAWTGRFRRRRESTAPSDSNLHRDDPKPTSEARGTPSTAPTEPGWYDDPENPDRQRYWNGWWTTRYRENPRQTNEDAGAASDDPDSLSASDKEALRGCLILALLIVGGIAVGVLALNSSGGSGDLSGAFVACRGFVRDELVAPSTADFHGWASEDTEHLGDGRYRTDSTVDAENSFGAMIRIHYTCIVRSSGGGWVLESLTYG